MELFIVRHSITRWVEQKRIQGHADIELNENGRIIAEKTYEGIKNIYIDAVYSSPLKRAYETAEILCKNRNIEIIKDNRLKEIAFGELEGADLSNIKPELDGKYSYFYENPEKYIPPKGGESYTDLCNRADDFMREIIKKHINDTRIMIVAHNTINKALLRFITEDKIKNLWKSESQKNCSIITAEISEKCYKIIEQNKIYY